MNTSPIVLDALPQFLAFGLPAHSEWLILLVLGLLIFGRRLPEVGRWLGQGIVEFKKGIKGVTDEIEEESSPKPAWKQEQPSRLPDQSREPAPAPKATQEHTSS